MDETAPSNVNDKRSDILGHCIIAVLSALISAYILYVAELARDEAVRGRIDWFLRELRAPVQQSTVTITSRSA